MVLEQVHLTYCHICSIVKEALLPEQTVALLWRSDSPVAPCLFCTLWGVCVCVGGGVPDSHTWVMICRSLFTHHRGAQLNFTSVIFSKMRKRWVMYGPYGCVSCWLCLLLSNAPHITTSVCECTKQPSKIDLWVEMATSIRSTHQTSPKGPPAVSPSKTRQNSDDNPPIPRVN